jgi:hypothetical protein
VYGATSKPNDLCNTLGKYPCLVIVNWKDVMLLLEGKVTLDIIKCAHDELIATFTLQKKQSRPATKTLTTTTTDATAATVATAVTGATAAAAATGVTAATVATTAATAATAVTAANAATQYV